MSTLVKIGAIAIATVVPSLILSLISAVPVYLLWNWLMPELFHLPVVTFWQALGIALLANILFKSNSSKSEK